MSAASTTNLPKAVAGRFGIYGGRYVPETLMAALEELETAYDQAKDDPAFQSELADLLHNYCGRPTPLYFAKRLSEQLGGAKIYLKREDLLHTGAHKINNALGQGLLARRMGKQRIIAETGAGQHGVATATVCALFGLECVIYMGEEDMRRQELNVYRMRLLGAEVRGVSAGSATLKDAIYLGTRVLRSIIDKDLLCVCVTFVDELAGSEFKVRNPNARSSCGCGVSFSI